MNSFMCESCGSTKLAYQKYVKCITPVSLQDDGRIDYNQSIINEDDYLATLNGFCCCDCGQKIEHCGIPLETEKELYYYLNLPAAERQKQNEEYIAMSSAQAEYDERKKQEYESLFNNIN